MPELPEVQAHAERLTEHLGGVELSGFRPITFTALKTFDPDPGEAKGHPLLEVGRRGKHLLLRFEPLTFVVHLMQGGRLKEEPVGKQPAKPRGGQARWTFADGRALLLTEAGTERRAGVWAVAGDPSAHPPLDHLGPEADRLGTDELAGILAAHPMRLHGFLRDQRVIAGIGRRLANEVCHRARLSPFAGTAKVATDPAAVQALVDAIAAAIEAGLATDRARADMSSSADRPGAVHHRAGEPCPVCGDTVRSVEYVRYTVSYCPTCQTGGKVLADNTTSRFLK
jgi:formamidopyrimidine-DNA glycosylase